MSRVLSPCLIKLFFKIISWLNFVFNFIERIIFILTKFSETHQHIIWKLCTKNHYPSEFENKNYLKTAFNFSLFIYLFLTPKHNPNKKSLLDSSPPNPELYKQIFGSDEHYGTWLSFPSSFFGTKSSSGRKIEWSNSCNLQLTTKNALTFPAFSAHFGAWIQFLRTTFNTSHFNFGGSCFCSKIWYISSDWKAHFFLSFFFKNPYLVINLYRI